MQLHHGIARACEDIDANRIVGRSDTGAIWQGSFPPPGRSVRRCGFDVLVLCAQELQPDSQLYDGVEIIRAPIDDAKITRREWALAWGAGNRVHHLIRAKKKVLITCAAGRNRSGLVTGIALALLTRASGEVIVRHIQRCRADALTNDSFVQALKMMRR